MSMVTPAFENNKDRLTYLFAEYKVPVSMMTVGLIGYYVHFNPSVDVPPWVPAFATALIFPGLPSYFAGRKVVKWLRRRNWVRVLEIRPEDEVLEPHVVPPKVWKNRKKGEYPAWKVRSGSTDFVVRELEYLDDIGRLEVEGVWEANVPPQDLVRSKTMLEETYGWLQSEAEDAHRYRAIMSSLGTRIQKKMMNAVVEAVEEGTHLDRSAVQGAVDDALGEVADERGFESPELAAMDDVAIDPEIADEASHADANPGGGDA